MKLWVDDIRDAPSADWNAVPTVTSAIDFISRFGSRITHISLDHDISYSVEVNGVGRPYPSPETFYAVALFIVAYYDAKTDKLPIITIHTSNPDGGKKMKNLFDDFEISSTLTPMQAVNRFEEGDNRKGVE